MQGTRENPEKRYVAKRSSGAGMGAIMVLFALAFIVLPFVFNQRVHGVAQIILIAFGVLLLIVGGIILIITRLYVKTAADESYVRTGMGGQKVIIDGGALVIPVVHTVIPIILNTMRIDVERKGQDALITGDKLRADIKAEFYIKVQKLKEDIVMAATSLGEKSVDPDNVKELINEKLISALRTVAATKPLYELNEKRDEFTDAVQKIVEKDLKHNGLTLETVTISSLDQTPPQDMHADTNVFDAEGSRKIAEITQKMRVETNLIHRSADQQVKEQDVKRDQFVYLQEVTRASAQADQDGKIRQAQAEAKQKADSFTFQQEQTAVITGVKKDQAIGVAEQEKNQAIQVANELRDQATETTRVNKEKAIEVTEREKQIAITLKEKERADAEAQKNKAAALAEQEKQNVETVTVKSTAQRNAEQAYIIKARAVDQAAYEKERQAQADATAQVNIANGKLKAAENEAQATITLAGAEKERLTKLAEGSKAQQMVPVDVAQRQVEVDSNRVSTVLKPELAAKAEFQQISVQLELGVKQITVNGEVQKAFANAMGQSLSNADIKVFADPNSMAQMMSMFTKGMSFANVIDGFQTAIDPATMKTLTDIVGGVKDAVVGIFRGIFGKTLDDTTVSNLAAKIVDNPSIITQIKDKAAAALTSGKGEAELAKTLVDTLGDGFKLKDATTLINTLKEDPSILGKLNDLLSKLPVAVH
jgi:flotillin